MGSPAHAGIDHAALQCQAAVMGFPRTRGDRPDRDMEALL